MILFSDYVEDKEGLRNTITGLLKSFLNKYPVELQEIQISFAPGFGDEPQRFDCVEIIVK